MCNEPNLTPSPIFEGISYIDLINAFYDSLSDSSLSAFEVSLWHALVQFCNRSYWQEWFPVYNKPLELYSGMSQSSISEYRARLAEKKYIEFRKSESRTKPTMYRILTTPFNFTATDYSPTDYSPTDYSCALAIVPQTNCYSPTDYLLRHKDNKEDTNCANAQNAHVQKHKGNNAKRKQNDRLEESFNRFWEAYPKRKNKKRAFDIWKKKTAHDDELVEKIISAVQNMVRLHDEKVKRDEWVAEYADPTTYLNGERWNDELEELPAKRGIVKYKCLD